MKEYIPNERMIIQKMVAINKQEKEAIVARFPDAHIMRTMKTKSKRHHYYCEETVRVMKFLAELRNGQVSYMG